MLDQGDIEKNLVLQPLPKKETHTIIKFEPELPKPFKKQRKLPKATSSSIQLKLSKKADNTNLDKDISVIPKSTSTPTSTSSVIPQRVVLPPPNFDVIFSKMVELFSYFWDLEISDPKVNGAFFGRIDEYTYKDFGLIRYQPNFINLLQIKANDINDILINE